jgi:F-type H+-transporting ATPase subunit epsilon
MTFELITPDGVKFTEEAYEVLLPTPQGQIAVLPHHMPLVSLAAAGVISVRRNQNDPDSKLDHFATAGGLIEVEEGKIRLLADSAQHADEVDELVAKEALERAQELQRSAQDDVSLADATAIIEENIARLKVADLRKTRHKL